MAVLKSFWLVTNPLDLISHVLNYANKGKLLSDVIECIGGFAFNEGFHTIELLNVV